ncbi:hypothetical protein PR048_001158 [Dryococelus australis]|uniref:Integrase catalytic domain-containing protein n=1 Tax=Dryococelus australis TaxID=614101 RepID=A0ABQ9IGL2_9NEOP|nr:hypothetical protein PR048_001158 [Dryococelus australis]
MHILCGQLIVKGVLSLTAAVLITHMRYIQADFGKPLVMVTDNELQFTSDQFNDFLRSNGICHLYTLPWHSSSNGLAEHTVQTVWFVSGARAYIKLDNGAIVENISSDDVLHRLTLELSEHVPKPFVYDKM